MKTMLICLLCMYLFSCLPGGSTDLDFYIDSLETQRLLGVSGQLYYVRSGIVNNNALRYRFTVAPNLTRNHFVWFNNGAADRTREIKYSLAFHLSSDTGLVPPTVNISKDGIIAHGRPEAFTVTLRCTGTDPYVDFTLRIAVVTPDSNFTVIDVRRRKLCTDETDVTYVAGADSDVGVASDLTTNPLAADAHAGDVDKTALEWPTSTDVFYIAIGVAVTVIFLITIGATLFYMRTKRKNLLSGNIAVPTTDDDDDFPSEHTFSGTNNETSFVDVDAHQSFPAPSSGQPGSSECGADSLVSPTQCVDSNAFSSRGDGPLHSIAISRSNVTIGELLMEGTFGRVYVGIAFLKSDAQEYGDQKVYVKTVSDDASAHQIKMLVTEGALLVGLKHANINPLLAICHAQPLATAPPLLLYASSDKGNLKVFLQKCVGTALFLPLSVQQTVCMTIQVAEALSYLHHMKVIHRDVATRNCIIDADLNVKVTDYALSRDCFPGDYHCLGDNENRPVKWMPLEALVEKKFSPAGDVWSYGVLLWELATYAQQPYADLDPAEMAAYLAAGYRCHQPSNCPDELFAVMACCWAATPAERPELPQILACLAAFRAMLDRYV